MFESYVASEEEEQAALFEWAAWKLQRWPELGLLFHIPNGGLRNKVTAAKLKSVGVPSPSFAWTVTLARKCFSPGISG